MSDATLVYDDDCGFCTWSADFIARRADVELVGFSGLDGDHEERLPEGYEECAHLVTDAEVYSCGASVEEALVRADLTSVDVRPLVEFLRQFEDYERLREWLYREVADRRGTIGRYISADTSHE